MAEYFRTRDSTVTIGSDTHQDEIESDIELSGGEKAVNDHSNIDGSQFSIPGNIGAVNITFDFRSTDNVNIPDMVYGPETTGGSPIKHTLNWGGAGTPKLITLHNVRATDGRILTVTLTDVTGISAPIKWMKGDIVIRTFNGIVDADNVLEELTEGT